ncbi:MAG: SUMF1/EgtB/PvdO family nonheme iron enzyme, partial [Gammaproteobacteria bacterium]|nr:SUMF1/EgtB/PvdO family nonheme iron enzyme [Gammaproteobacteria bacterium]
LPRHNQSGQNYRAGRTLQERGPSVDREQRSNPPEKEPVKVFISYSHDSVEHTDRVLDLSNRLREEGVECCIDQYEMFPPQGWEAWMLNRLEEADFVLAVCTETYVCYAAEKESTGWMGAILTDELYRHYARNTHFIPLLFSSLDEKHIPPFLGNDFCCTVADDNGYEHLYRHLTKQPAVEKPKLGKLKKRPARERKQHPMLAKELSADFGRVMEDSSLSLQIKARDEFTHHTDRTHKLIKKAAAKLERLPMQNPEYRKIILMAGVVLSSVGDLKKTKELLLKAKEISKTDEDRGLIHFNLFQIDLRSRDYRGALDNLQEAIKICPERYALHDVKKYPIERLLGSGGMGVVFLCQYPQEKKKAVVKCFWKKREGAEKEAAIMRDVAGKYVPEIIDYDYSGTERAYFVTEYIEGAIDGATWLKKYGKLGLKEGLEVGRQIAEALLQAHEKDICHLDLKPANVLLKRVEKGGIEVKIIDFGLSRVANSLQEEAITRQHSQLTLSVAGQGIMGTLDYAPPEQLGYGPEYGKPDAKSDVYSFGTTLYHLMTAESPRFPDPRKLPELQGFRELLLECVESFSEKRPNIEEVKGRLHKLIKKIGLKKRMLFDSIGLFIVMLIAVFTWQYPAIKATWILKTCQDHINANRLIDGEGDTALSCYKEVLKLKPGNPQALAGSKKIEEKLAELTVRKSEQKEFVKAWGYLRGLHKLNPKSVYLPQAEKVFREKRTFRDTVKKDGTSGPEMVWILAGKFRMGDVQGKWKYSNEKPVHEVSIDRFAIGVYEITFDEYDKFAQAAGRKKPDDEAWGREDRPVIHVSWDDAQAYAEWLSEQTGERYRLPTEAEWEYAARAGTETDYFSGDKQLQEHAWHSENAGRKTHPVGEKKPNAWGVYDMHGNVWEWVQDWYGENYYANSPVQNPVGPDSGSDRVARGGSCYDSRQVARSAYRSSVPPGDRDWLIGFRFARDQ